MLNENKCEKIDENFEYGKTYYFDKSGIYINETDVQNLKTECVSMVKACCRLQLPKGFNFSQDCPGMCFDLSNLTCIKSPLTQRLIIPDVGDKHAIECEPVVGYEIRAIGDVNFSVSTPLCPENGCCFPVRSHTCCYATAPVNNVISYSCCPQPCPSGLPCVDWTFAFFVVRKMEDCCSHYLHIDMGVALEYTGVCDCEEE